MKIEESSIYDPLGIEIFAIDETFESVFNGLKGVYLRLFYKESHKPEEERDRGLEEAFLKRFRELGRLKGSYRYNDWKLKRKAVEQYSEELKRMVALELKNYATIS